MELGVVKNELLEIKTALAFTINAVECYLFGSILRSSLTANDIDILIVYQEPEHLKTIKQSFTSLETCYPLHLTYLTYSEEQEFNFVVEQKAEKIFTL